MSPLLTFEMHSEICGRSAPEEIITNRTHAVQIEHLRVLALAIKFITSCSF